MNKSASYTFLRLSLLSLFVVLLTTLTLTGCLSVVESIVTAEPDFVTEAVVGDDQQEIPFGETATVVRIIDGDTIDVDLDGQIYRVRYIGINTPERDEPCYAEATQANADLVENQTVQLVQDISNTDRFDRLLRYVYVGDIFVNAQLVSEGWAESVHYPPDTFYADTFDDLAAVAASENIGCYPSGVFGP